jgi:methyltransferase (TIGR00027 family)
LIPSWKKNIIEIYEGIMSDKKNSANIPDSSAVRVSLWRALHTEVDAKPSVLEDVVGLKLIEPDANWRQRPDMHPQGTAGYRASIVARARFLEDLVEEQLQKNVHQYVVLGAGIDTFAQRKPAIASKLKIFEVDKVETQEWKRRRLVETGFGIPDYLKLVPVDFEANESWLQKITTQGFDPKKPAVISSTGVSMYLTKEAVKASLQEIAKLAPGSTLAMTYMLELELLDAAERPQHQAVHAKAREAGTPFLSFFYPDEIVKMALSAGFKKALSIETAELEKYFAKRSDGLRPAKGEGILVAST